MNLIVAVDKNWGIGYNNELLVKIPDDMKMFRRKTINNVVVMGRKTLESFPNTKPLKDRLNIILTTDISYEAEGAVVLHSINELLNEVKQYNSEDIFVIGGASIYKQLLQYCDTAYITKIQNEYVADTYFPDLEKDNNWEMLEESDVFEHETIKYTFTKWRRKNGKD